MGLTAELLIERAEFKEYVFIRTKAVAFERYEKEQRGLIASKAKRRFLPATSALGSGSSISFVVQPPQYDMSHDFMGSYFSVHNTAHHNHLELRWYAQC